MRASGRHERESAELGRFVAELAFDQLPQEVLDALKASLLDTVGVALAAASEPDGAQEAVRFGVEQAGTPESTIWRLGRQVPSAAAAFANGALARALDFDDIYDHGPIHVGAAVVPTALAAAERRSAPVSGQEFLAALAAGGEILCRCGLVATEAGAREHVPPALYSQLFGYFGATAAAARILGLQQEAIESAFGIALMQAAGTLEVVSGGGSGGKVLYGAFCNQGGTQSALLAESGVDCRCAAFTGRAGLFSYHLRGAAPTALLLEALGESFHVSELGLKPWPCTKVSHPFVEAALSIQNRGRVDSRVSEIILDVGRWGKQFCEPLDERRRPKSPPAAKNSLPYVAAVALVRGDVCIEDFREAALSDPAVLDVAGRTRFRFQPERSTALGYEPGRVEVRTHNGDVYADEVEVPLGDHRRPMSSGIIDAKFRHCAVDVGGLHAERAERCIALCRGLEEVGDVRELVACTSG